MSVFTLVLSAELTFHYLCDPAVCSISSFPYRKDALFVRGLYLVDELATIAKAFKGFVQSDRWKAVLVLSFLNSYDTFFECFIAMASSGPFQTLFSRLIDILPIQEESLASQSLSISAAVAIAYIRYEYWKQCTLRNMKGLACEAKPTVYKHKQKQMQPSSN